MENQQKLKFPAFYDSRKRQTRFHAMIFPKVEKSLQLGCACPLGFPIRAPDRESQRHEEESKASLHMSCNKHCLGLLLASLLPASTNPQPDDGHGLDELHPNH